MNDKPPDHHIRYARAWALHQDEDCSEDSRLILESEMDSAQDCFSFQEFQEFKITLPGFVQYWDSLITTLIKTDP